MPRRTRWAPSNSARVNWGHPLAAKMVLAVPTFPCVDLCKQRVASHAGNLLGPGRASIYGRGAVTTGASFNTDGISSALSADCNFSSGPFTILAMGWLTNAGGYPMAIGRMSHTSEAVNSGWNLQYRLTDGWTFSTYNNNAFATYALKSNLDVNAEHYFVAGTSDGTTKRLYINGQQVGTNTNSPNPGTDSTGSLFFGNENNFSGTISCSSAFAWARCLSANDIATLYADPYCMIDGA